MELIYLVVAAELLVGIIVGYALAGTKEKQ